MDTSNATKTLKALAAYAGLTSDDVRITRRGDRVTVNFTDADKALHASAVATWITKAGLSPEQVTVKNAKPGEPKAPGVLYPSYEAYCAAKGFSPS